MTSARGLRPKIGRRVVIYGAGDTAMDAARTAKRLGATEALIVFFSDRAHMEAHDFEAAEALSEGVKIKWLSTIHDIEAEALTVELMALDDKGIPQPTGKFETLQADSVILALGQQAESGFLAGIPGIVVKPDGTVIVGPRYDDRSSRHLRRWRHGAEHPHRHHRDRSRQEGGTPYRRLAPRPGTCAAAQAPPALASRICICRFIVTPFLRMKSRRRLPSAKASPR